MDELMKMLLENLMNEQMKREERQSSDSKKDSTISEQDKKAIDSYVSLISAEERAAVEKVSEAVSNLIDVHNKCVMENLAKDRKVKKTTPLQRIIYMMCGDFIKEVQSNIISVLDADTIGVEHLAKYLTENGETLEHMEKKLIARSLAKKLFE